jgi:DNA polymerase-1
VNFAYVYGSGAGNIAETCDITVPKAREVIKGFERTYPGVKKLSDRLQQQAKAKGYIVTAFGRVIRTDTDRPYAALNYMVQSSSRDITARALLRLDKAGFTPYLRLPIHDEILAEVPEERAKGASEKIARIMEEELYGVLIASDAEVLGKSWGGGYINPDDPQDALDYEATFK